MVLHLAFLWLFSGLLAGIHAMALQVVDGGLPARSIVVSRLSSGGSFARAALQNAAALSVHHRWPLFRLVFKTVGLNIAGAAFLGIGLFVAFPVTVLLTARFFRTLQAAPTSALAGVLRDAPQGIPRHSAD